MFSSKSFIVPGLTFMLLIYFEYIFEYGVREFSDFILFMQLSAFPTPFIEETVLSPLYIFTSFVLD